MGGGGGGRFKVDSVYVIQDVRLKKFMHDGALIS